MSGFLWFDCNYGCGEKIGVNVADWSEYNGGCGSAPADKFYPWLGKQIMDSLMYHHLNHCTEYHKQIDGRPSLLVNS